MITPINSMIVDLLDPHGTVLIDAPLSAYTTFHTGGPADILVVPYTLDSAIAVYRIAKEHAVPVTIIGGGSNLLVSDRGIRGITIRLCTDSPISELVHIREDGRIYADARLQKWDFIDFTQSHGFTGMEFMAGIPGCMGGGIIMNAGTGAGVFADILAYIAYLDAGGVTREKIVTRDMTTYRRLQLDDAVMILSGVFSLSKTDRPDLTRAMIDETIRERGQKHPLDYPSAGSVFKNPAGQSSWKLIRDAGLAGRKQGGAMVSTLHTNFIINYDHATTTDIVQLIEIITERVCERFGVHLDTEVRMLGEF